MTASRVDANQPAIVEALRKAGAVVIPINKQRDAGFDVIVIARSIRGKPRVWLAEIKMPRSRKELTPCERTRAQELNDFGVYHVITSVEEALQMIGRA